MGQKRLRALERLWNTLQTSNYFKSMTCELSPCPSTYAAISRILCRWSRGTSASSRSVALPEDQEKLCDCACCKHFENSLKPSAQCPGFPRFSFYYACFWWESSENDLQDLQSGVQEVVLTVSFRCRPFRPCRGNCEIGLKSDEIVRICRRLSEMFRFHWCSTLIRHSFGPKLNIVSVQSVQSVQSVFLLKLLKCI